MSYKAKVVKVMIASPSDVQPERQAIRNVIQEWNFTHSEDKNIVLMPVGWESHSAPSVGERPQAILNKQVLAGCDLLIAVFWTKLGTPTGRAASGTVEEIEKHIKAKKPAMIYFSKVALPAEMVDQKQYKALMEFKEKIGKSWLYSEYSSPEDFSNQLNRQLAQTVLRHFTSKKNVNGHSVDDFAVIRANPPLVSGPARQLLIEATQDQSGVIFRMCSLAFLTIFTNGIEMVDSQDLGTRARWEDALKELQTRGLLENRGGKGQVFSVTDKGYRAADLLRERQFVG